jgi:FixJ family two-component response regulator
MVKRQTVVAVVDDDPSMVKAMENLLDAHGYGVRAFASGEEFLDCAALAELDCLLLDIHLGGISGIELQRQLKTRGYATPIIFMTALDDESARQQALNAGCVAYLRKPFPAHLLFEALNKA